MKLLTGNLFKGKIDLLSIIFLINIPLLFANNSDFETCYAFSKLDHSFLSEEDHYLMNIPYTDSIDGQIANIQEAIYKCDSSDYKRKFHLYFILSAYLDQTKRNNQLSIDYEKIIYSNKNQPCIHTNYMIDRIVQKYRANNRHKKLLEILHKFNDIDIPNNYIDEQLGNIYFHLGKYELAIIHWQYIIKYGTRGKVSKSSFHNNIALAYRELSNFQLAKKHFSQSLNLLNEVEKESKKERSKYFYYFKNIVKNNLLSISKNKKNIKLEMFKNYQKALKNGLETKKQSIGILSYTSISSLAFELGKFEEAQKYLRIVDEESSNKNLPKSTEREIKKIEFLNNLYKATNDTSLINQYLSITRENSNEFIKKINLLRSTEKIDVEWSLKTLSEKEELLLREEKIKKKLQLFNTLLIILGSGLVFALIWQELLRQKIRQKNLQIKQALETSQILLKEVNHRVKNNLEIISSIAYLEYIKEGVFDFYSFENKINALSLIHQLLYTSDNISSIDLKQYYTKLLENFKDSLIINLEYKLNTPEKFNIPIETGIILGILLNELITNSSKYCNPKEEESITVKIDFYQQNKVWIFEYQDNGTKFDQSNSKSDQFGSQLMMLLVKKLKAEQSTSFENGYTTKIIFKQLIIA
ncbi:MAG: hypothetical protein N4A45_13790 [Flavobacteriales bacterium]|jgi:two-component sensor histidine kinase|nr:hypothetical protein [Flavobacteriales bacterium]